MNSNPFAKRVLIAALRRGLPVVLWVLAASPAMAGGTKDPFRAWHAVPDRELATMRGGFITSDGLNISVGLEQVVTINGEVKVRNTINLTDLGRGHSSVTPVFSADGKTVNFVQNGANNQISPDVQANFADGSLTVIQNSLDDQDIRNLNLLKIDVSGLSHLHNNPVDASLGVQMIRSLR